MANNVGSIKSRHKSRIFFDKIKNKRYPIWNQTKLFFICLFSSRNALFIDINGAWKKMQHKNRVSTIKEKWDEHLLPIKYKKMCCCNWHSCHAELWNSYHSIKLYNEFARVYPVSLRSYKFNKTCKSLRLPSVWNILIDSHFADFWSVQSTKKCCCLFNLHLNFWNCIKSICINEVQSRSY